MSDQLQIPDYPTPSTELEGPQSPFPPGYSNPDEIIQAVRQGKLQLTETGGYEEETPTFPGDVPQDDDPGLSDEDAYEDEGGDDQEEPFMVAGLDLTDYSDEFYRYGDLSEESIDEIEDMGIPRSLIEAHVAHMQASLNLIDEGAEAELIDRVVGGANNLDAMIDWAMDVGSDEEKASLAEALESGSGAFIELALQNLMARYEMAQTQNPDLVRGKASPSEAAWTDTQIMNAMKDPRYANPALDRGAYYDWVKKHIRAR